MTAMFTGAEQVTVFCTDIAHAEEVCDEKRTGKTEGESPCTRGRAVPRPKAMSIYTGGCCYRVSLVRCLHRARRCRSALSHPGSQTSKDIEESSDHSPCHDTLHEVMAPEKDETSDDGTVSEVMKKTRKRSLCLPTVSLPPELQSALELVLSRHPSSSLVEDGQSLARHLYSRQAPSKVDESKRRKGEVKVVPGDPWTKAAQHKDKETVHTIIRYGEREAVAYAASRLQATYGTTLRVLSEIARQVPMFQPETLLDFGSGLGTVEWAAHQLWGKSLHEYQCVDSSREMGDLARVLLTGGEEIAPEEGSLDLTTTPNRAAISDVHFRQYLPVSNKVQYDLVVSSYSLGDVPAVKLRRLSVASLWRKTKQFLVLIEPGNETGFRNIIEARDMILNAATMKDFELDSGGSEDREDEIDNLEGHVFAPCPHDFRCPLAAERSKTPCHFGQRVQLAFCERKSLKHKGFHIENFSYMVLRKGKRPEITEGSCSRARLLQPVKKRTRHILCKLCCPDGNVMEQLILTKSKHKELYKDGRRSQWGDLLPLPAEKK